MQLITQEIDAQLRANALKTQEDPGHDPMPVVKFFNPMGAGTWIITDRDLEYPDILFGLCDLGMGFPEVGSVCLSELESVSIAGLGIERDLHFDTQDQPLSVWAEAAHQKSHITEDTKSLLQARAKLVSQKRLK